MESVSVDLTDMAAGSAWLPICFDSNGPLLWICKVLLTKNKCTEEVAEAFTKDTTTFGIPATLVMGNGGEFTSQLFKTLCQTYNIQTGYTTPYHPRGNIITERIRRTLKGIQATLCNGHPLLWPKLLGQYQLVVNTAVHTTTGQQPDFAFFSRHAPRQVGVKQTDIPSEPDGIQIAHEIIQATHQKMATRYRGVANLQRKNQAFLFGDLTWVRYECTIPGTSR